MKPPPVTAAEPFEVSGSLDDAARVLADLPKNRPGLTVRRRRFYGQNPCFCQDLHPDIYPVTNLLYLFIS